MNAAALDLAAVEALVRSAAHDELLPCFRRTTRHEKADGSWLTEADLAMQEHIKSALATRHPDIRFLGEEMEPAEQEHLLAASGGGSSGLWVLDPLDGTSNFSAGIPLFGVSLALMRNGRIEAGIVYDPMHDESFAAALGAGATLNGEPLRVQRAGIPLAKTTACIDFKRLPPSLAARIAATPPYSSQRSIGSVALDWCWVAAGRFHIYLHGRQNLWDYAAGSLVLTEAGGFADTLDGMPAPLSLAPRSAVCAADSGLFQAWRDYLRTA
ncbi:MAG: inositol monophosphatase [Gammaproteobacteria bacterium]|nr:inositol monophosphatase [Gammaproteobacteria bacterium]MBU1644758.1 inositol monophosphatase [Gammaproteobacteria bacterium]MBU1973492.1 inositol monophosphatase [Gammaproteobacteria bacterium]